MKFLALAAAASALRLTNTCDCDKSASNQATSCTNYATACPGLAVNASFCCKDGALKTGPPAGCAGFSC